MVRDWMAARSRSASALPPAALAYGSVRFAHGCRLWTNQPGVDEGYKKSSCCQAKNLVAFLDQVHVPFWNRDLSFAIRWDAFEDRLAA